MPKKNTTNTTPAQANSAGFSEEKCSDSPRRHLRRLCILADDPRFTTPAKSALCGLSRFVDDEGICWPRIATVMRVTGLPRATLYEGLTLLQELRILARRGRTFMLDADVLSGMVSRSTAVSTDLLDSTDVTVPEGGYKQHLLLIVATSAPWGATYARIAARSGMSRRSAIRGLAALRDAGRVQIDVTEGAQHGPKFSTAGCHDRTVGEVEGVTAPDGRGERPGRTGCHDQTHNPYLNPRLNPSAPPSSPQAEVIDQCRAMFDRHLAEVESSADPREAVYGAMSRLLHRLRCRDWAAAERGRTYAAVVARSIRRDFPPRTPHERADVLRLGAMSEGRFMTAQDTLIAVGVLPAPNATPSRAVAVA
jgi:hypothetical protein